MSKVRRASLALCASAVFAAPSPFAAPAETPPSPPPQSGPACTDLLDGLRGKVAADYAGYHLEVVGTRRQEHDRIAGQLARLAGLIDRHGCLSVLARYLEWFDDPHLFLYQRAELSAEETESRRDMVVRLDVDESAVAPGAPAGSATDAIEGVWADGGMRMAIVPDPEASAAPGSFVAVVTRTDTPTLPVGSVRARLWRGIEGRYSVVLRSRSLAETVVTGSVHRGSILRISPDMWGKVRPIPAAVEGVVDPTDVRRPTLAARGGTVIVSIPSHDPQLRVVVDSLVAANRPALEAARRLIVDLRGNEGGGALTTDALLPYLVDASTATGSSGLDRAVMLSSPDQIYYAARAFGPPESEFVTRLVRALEAAPGALVPLLDPSAPREPAPRVEPVYGPERVALLVDRGTVSAAEILVRRVRGGSRTIVLGTPTAGALDYQSTFLVRFHDGEDDWLLGYPTITAHPELPDGGIRGRGIRPDVLVEWDSIPDPYAYAERILESSDPPGR